MIVIDNDNIVYFDVDDTLVMWKFKKKNRSKTIVIGDGKFNYRVLPNQENIAAIKKAKARGHTVVVWSQGGWRWAHKVVKTLRLEKYVDVLMPKPRWIYDDIPSTEWMPKPFYFPAEQ